MRSTTAEDWTFLDLQFVIIHEGRVGGCILTDGRQPYVIIVANH